MVESVGRRAFLSFRSLAEVSARSFARRGFLNFLKRKARGPPMMRVSGDSWSMMSRRPRERRVRRSSSDTSSRTRFLIEGT